MKDYKFTIVTPTLNQGETIERTIVSVLSQGVKNLEYIIIDGGSNDKTLDIIKKYEKHIHYWHSKKDNGMYDAINTGFSRGTGNIFSYLNSDDYYFPGSLSTVLSKFQNYPSLKFLYGDYMVDLPNGNQLAKPKISWDYQIALNAYLMIPQPSSFWSRELFEENGGFNTQYEDCGDYDFFLKACKKLNGEEILHIYNYLSCFTIHPQSKTVTRQSKFKYEMKKIRKNNSMIFNPIIRRFIKYFYLFKTLYKYKRERGLIPLKYSDYASYK